MCMFKKIFWLLTLLTLHLTITLIQAASIPDTGCMGCHGQPEIARNARNKSSFIDPAKYSGTTHSIIGCTVCHDRVSPGHPGDGYLSPKAVCGDCHGPVNDEYVKSVHGTKARCNDCHNPHEVRLPFFMSGDEINGKCAKCHDSRKTIQSHAKWLPQADLHIDSLLCISCHTSSREYAITLSIESRAPGSGTAFKLATFPELTALSTDGNISKIIDQNGDNMVSLAELRAFNHHLRSRNMRLWGMMTPEVVTHNYQIMVNRWDCSFCHASGSKAMQKSFIVLPGKNGDFSRIPVEKGAIFDILYGTPDFYMMGSTRSTALNIIGALIVATGLSFPVCHGFFRFLTRKNRKEEHHEA